MKYLICKTQKGEGCDYTIGCGMVYYVEYFDGSFEEALEYFSKRVKP